MAPGLPYTADEVWAFVPGRDCDSVHMAVFPKAEPADEELLSRWQALLEVRAAVTKSLEEARAQKQIAASLESRLTLRAPEPVLKALAAHDATGGLFPGNLASLFIVSHVALAGAADAVAVEVARAAGAKCERCWTWSEKVGKLSVHAGVCERCADVLARSS
jgi:isoleucyl-tRNA synthetase